MDAQALWGELVRGKWIVEDWFDDGGVRIVVARRNDAIASHGQSSLSAREKLVLSRVAAGHSNKRIAYDLGLAVSSVASYVSRAAAKLGATSRIDLVRAHCELRDLDR